MKKRLKNLLNQVERLGLDTQAIRDLLLSDTDLGDYEARVTNLEREIKKYPPGSQPQQVQIMVTHLKPRPKEATFKNNKLNLTAENYIVQEHKAVTDPNLTNAIEALSQQIAKQQLALPPVSSPPAITEQAKPEIDNSEVLKAIQKLNDKVDNIKVTSGQSDIDPDAPKMNEGFVNPLDEREVEKLKGEVHIVPKKGKPITSSLQKLRDLKK